MKHHRFPLLTSVLTLLVCVLAGVPEHVIADEPPELEHILRAKDYRDEGDLRAAVIELKNALQKNPESPEARRLLGETYLGLNEGAAAEKELRRALDAGLAPQAALAALGEALLMQGENSELLDEIVVDSAWPKALRAKLHALRGEAQLGLRKPDEAAKEFESALAADPRSAAAHVGQARLALAEGKTDEAHARIKQALEADAAYAAGWTLLGELEQGQGRNEEAAAAFDKAVEQRPQSGSLRLKRALVRIDLGDYAGAAEDIALVKRPARDHPGVHYAEGLLNFRQGRFADAEAALRQAMITVPNHLPSAFYLGAAHYELGNLEQAEEHLGRVVRAVPQADDARRLLGATRFRREDFNGAEEALAPLLQRNPEDAVAARLMGKALVALGRSEEGNRYLEQAVASRPESAGDRLELAGSYLATGEPTLAIPELQAALELDPTLLRADLMLIQAHLQSDETDQALAAAERLREKQPDNPGPLTLMGIAYGGKGDIERAREAFEQALAVKPGDPSAATNLAALALSAGDVGTARGYYLQILEHNPGHPATLLRLADLELRRGDAAAARARLEEAVRGNPEALSPRVALARFQFDNGEALQALGTLDEAPARYAEHPELLAALGEARLSAGQMAMALRPLETLVHKQPESARAHYLLGSAQVANRDAASAKRSLLEGMRLNPDDMLASWLMTQIMRLTPEVEDKNALLQELKGGYPDHPQVLDLEAQAMTQDDPARAVEIYRGLSERFPDTPVWVRQLAKAQWASGDRDGHVATLTDWLADHPEDVASEYMLANSYLRLERLDQAREAFSHVVERAPNNVAALNNLAWLLHQAKDPAALDYARRAHELAPDRPEVADTLGWLLLDGGDPARGLELIQEAARKVPHQPSIRYHLAAALAKNERSEDAKKELNRLLRDHKDFPEVGEAEALLAELEGQQ